MTRTFDELLSSYMDDPKFREAYADAEALSHLREALVCIRKAQDISQAEVARRMGVGQSTVSGFETSANDPRISTLQRYARAVSAELQLKVDLPAQAAWRSAKAKVTQWESQVASVEKSVVPQPLRSGVDPSALALANAWTASRRSRPEDFALSA